jgi:hypothetical protein
MPQPLVLARQAPGLFTVGLASACLEISPLLSGSPRDTSASFAWLASQPQARRLLVSLSISQATPVAAGDQHQDPTYEEALDRSPLACRPRGNVTAAIGRRGRPLRARTQCRVKCRKRGETDDVEVAGVPSEPRALPLGRKGRRALKSRDEGSGKHEPMGAFRSPPGVTGDRCARVFARIPRVASATIRSRLSPVCHPKPAR